MILLYIMAYSQVNIALFLEALALSSAGRKSSSGWRLDNKTSCTLFNIIINNILACYQKYSYLMIYNFNR